MVIQKLKLASRNNINYNKKERWELKTKTKAYPYLNHNSARKAANTKVRGEAILKQAPISPTNHFKRAQATLLILKDDKCATKRETLKQERWHICQATTYSSRAPWKFVIKGHDKEKHRINIHITSRAKD